VTANPTNPSRPDLWQMLHLLQLAAVKVNGKPLFQLGQPCRGVYLVEEGEVTLRLSSSANGCGTFEVVGPGTVLGLSEVMTGGTYRLTAEASQDARISYIDRDSFLDLVHSDHQFCLQIVRALSEDLHGLYHRCRCLMPATGRDTSLAVN
jgi:CRP-like cAMP-binding protein